jgi:hypothetical protein
MVMKLGTLIMPPEITNSVLDRFFPSIIPTLQLVKFYCFIGFIMNT